MSHAGDRGPGPGEDCERELQEWREHVFRGVAWTMVGAASIVVTVVTMVGPTSYVVPLATLSVGLLGAVAFRERLGYRLAVGLLLGVTYACACVSIAHLGFAPNLVVLFETLVIVAALLLGRAWALALTALSAGSLVGIWVLHRSGAFDAVVDTATFVALVPDDWRGILRVTMSYLCLSTISVVAASYLLERAILSLESKAVALEELQRKQAEADRLRDELRRSDEAFAKARELEVLGRLAGSVAHDFNNALLIIQGNADIVRYDPAYLPTALDDIGAAVQQAASTTRQLRALGQVSSGVRPLPLDLREAVNRTVKLLRRLLPSNITVEVAAEEGVVVVADDGELQNLLTNLALNARDAMREGGRLDLNVTKATGPQLEGAGLRGNFAIIEVKDNGGGMSPETQERLFEPYFTTKRDEGTGLGLVSVKKVVEERGGRIVVSSELGRGTALQIFWPLAEEAGATAADAAAPARGNATVLLVEDDPLVLSTIAEALRQRGLIVLTASEGADAMVVARRHHGPIDILCSDCLMPGPPVRQLVESFRDAYPGAKVVLCSGHAPEEIGPPLQHIDAFLPKPFTPDALVAIIGELARKAERASAAHAVARRRDETARAV
jgi:two-component system cell cycle sensor histidine kinase/response regulator CckA